MPRRRKKAKPPEERTTVEQPKPGLRIERKTIELNPSQPRAPAIAMPSGVTATELATRALHRRAMEARSDMPKFYDFTIKHETTKAQLTTAAHQRVMFVFVIDHPHCVIRQPIGTGKTFGMAAVGMYLMGQDPTQRGAIVSKAQGQAVKVLRMVGDYITDPNLSAPLNLVFPWVKRSTRPGEQWTQSALTIDRPAGIRDPSLVAVGIDGAIQGARLSWVLGDDILDADNTLTVAGREQTHSRFDARILSRLDPVGSRAVVTNTPWHLQDLTFKLEQAGWPTMSMDIYGNIWFSENVSRQWIESTGLLRPSAKRKGCWRLVEHDPDQEEATPLWPERYSLDTIKQIRATRLPHEFARLFLCTPFDESALRCQRSWIDAAKNAGRGMLHLIGKGHEGLPTYTGVDIGVGTSMKHDKTCLFTFQLLEDGRRLIIDVDAGQWSGPIIASKIIDKHDKFSSIIAVESNTAQDFVRQFAQSQRPDLRVRAHTTSKASKHNVDFGVESIFTELQNGQWVIPCDDRLNTNPEIEEWTEECMYYQPPPAHTGDRLMASWIARECSRRGGGGRDPLPAAGGKLQMWATGGF